MIWIYSAYAQQFVWLTYFFRFIYLRERESKQEGQRERERILKCEAWCGAPYHVPEIMTWAEIKSWTLNQPCQPGSPVWLILSDRTQIWITNLKEIMICKAGNESYITQVSLEFSFKGDTHFFKDKLHIMQIIPLVHCLSFRTAEIPEHWSKISQKAWSEI